MTLWEWRAEVVDDPKESVSWVAQQMATRREHFIAELMAATRLQIRSLDHDLRMVDLLEASITENVVAATHFLEHGSADSEVEAPTAALIYARALAQRDVPLSALIRAYRIGHAQFVDEAMGLLGTLAPDRSLPAVVELVNRSARWIDRVCDQVGVAYEQERDRWVSSRSGLRQQWVNQLLSGAAVDISRAEDALEYRLNGLHIAALVWPEAEVPTRDVVTLFDRARALIAPELGAAGRSLMVPTDEREARLWFSVRATDGPDPSRLRTSLKTAGLPVRLAVGAPGEGLEGFRQALRRAERARAVALAGGERSAPVVFYQEVAPVALMAEDFGELRFLVSRVLGDLAVDDERNGWLRETLREFLARNRSFAATAEAMFLHRNTIQYRVAQAMELCGHSFDDADAMLDVQIALMACRWMSPAVLASHERTKQSS
jgi:DNA-binding PucR family transcriptional regulator